MLILFIDLPPVERRPSAALATALPLC